MKRETESMPGHDVFTPADLVQLEARGVGVDEALRQIELLSGPARFATLDRVCTLGDGIRMVDAESRARCLDAGRAAAAAGRASRFVPASGAATRMFADLIAFLSRPGRGAAFDEAARAGDGPASAAAALLDGLPRFAFRGLLAGRLAAAGHDLDTLVRERDAAPVLHALLDADGLGCASLPKGLIPFHRHRAGTRTAFEEQLIEAAELVCDTDGVTRLHFTVSPEHRDGFKADLAGARKAIEAGRARRLKVTFSVQKPSTDTLALDGDGRPFRQGNGRLLFRPAGHGALIENLGEFGGDLVLIKNIDNVVPDHLKGPTLEWSRVLLGMLADVQSRSFELLHRLDSARGAADVDEAVAFMRDVFDDELPLDTTSPEARYAAVVALLHRPIRVCGMVPNTGEPGGGPFFVRARDGVAGQQIVESAQVDHDVPAQEAIFRASTHFNPVFIACGLRDHRAQPYDLQRYVDPEAVIVARKTHDGRPLKALERPGLWNGAMAQWSTIFVEVPIEVFNPVKTILDLLRPEHQPAPGPASDKAETY